MGEPSSDGASEKVVSTSGSSGEKERAPWPVTLGTLLALQLGWGLWLMPAVYARSVSLSDTCTQLRQMLSSLSTAACPQGCIWACTISAAGTCLDLRVLGQINIILYDAGL